MFLQYVIRVLADFTSLSVGYSDSFFARIVVKILPVSFSSERRSNAGFPIICAYCCIIFAQIPLMVRNSNLFLYPSPKIETNLFDMSLVAAMVYVSVNMLSGQIPSQSSIYPNLFTSTVVFPLPGTASINTGPFIVCTAFFWFSFRCFAYCAKNSSFSIIQSLKSI